MHARRAYGDAKEIDQTYRKLRLRLAADLISDEWTEVDEVDAINYMVSSVFDFATRPVFCTHCSFAHSDRDWFAVHPHRRHQCHGCGFQFSEAVTRRRSCCRTRSAAALKCCPSTSTSAHGIRRSKGRRRRRPCVSAFRCCAACARMSPAASSSHAQRAPSSTSRTSRAVRSSTGTTSRCSRARMHFAPSLAATDALRFGSRPPRLRIAICCAAPSATTRCRRCLTHRRATRASALTSTK
ncbi:hypothetical protein BCO37747_04004 [Burkholderia contaminans]|nr:hypothetical protein SK875_B02697 [Burkholderia contaminans]VWB86888.1 hypothetical protein BCO23253_04188 [Burkholderia contaminans]VWD21981.1 hypothetical protein BCO37747_04004 [Burkholderia contaminans]